ncbi:MAG: hypothetical protein L0241_24030 [Planctomycetia bacterium]|nr:hypothetical protein [Planctomycetia bacterium]
MPNSPEHRAKYTLNRAFLNTGIVTTNPEWAGVVAFYAAVHLVERLAAAEPRGSIHHRTHADRRVYLAQHRHHRAILNDYEILQDASEISRYGTVNQFNSLYSAATVQSVLIDTHLVAIEDYVTAYFAPPSPPPTPPATPPPPSPPPSQPPAATGS